MTSRLTRDAWIAHGFDVLRTTGHEALKADTMCKALGVSRGSFYWHFPSLSDFHNALLVAWRHQNTETVIAELQGYIDEASQLVALIQKAVDTPQPLENAMRRWGGANEGVAAALNDVDQTRRAYLADLLSAAGIEDQEAQDRATLLVWAMVGRSFVPAFAANVSRTIASDISGLLLPGPQRRTDEDR